MKTLGLYLGFPPEGGGAFQYAQTILAAVIALPRSEYEVVVAHAHSAWPAHLQSHADRMRTVNLQPVVTDTLGRLALRFGFPLPLWHSLVRHVRSTERALLREAADLWLFPAQDHFTYSLPAPTVGVVHDLMHRYERRFPEVSKRGLYRRRERHYQNMCGHAAAILVDSVLGKQHVLSAYDVAPDRVYVLPFAAPAYISTATIPADFDARMSLPPEYILYPAQMWQHKNHVHLIEALAKVRATHPALHLVLVGSRKNASREIQAVVTRLGLDEAVQMLGYVPDAYMAPLYRRSRGLVMPTYFGPTNIPPLEAMAVGCPMALSDVYAMREQSGDAAIYFDPASVDEIAEAITRLLDDTALRQRLHAAAVAQATRHDQTTFNQHFGEIVRSILPPT